MGSQLVPPEMQTIFSHGSQNGRRGSAQQEWSDPGAQLGCRVVRPRGSAGVHRIARPWGSAGVHRVVSSRGSAWGTGQPDPRAQPGVQGGQTSGLSRGTGWSDPRAQLGCRTARPRGSAWGAGYQTLGLSLGCRISDLGAQPGAGWSDPRAPPGCRAASSWGRCRRQVAARGPAAVAQPPPPRSHRARLRWLPATPLWPRDTPGDGPSPPRASEPQGLRLQRLNPSRLPPDSRLHSRGEIRSRAGQPALESPPWGRRRRPGHPGCVSGLRCSCGAAGPAPLPPPPVACRLSPVGAFHPSPGSAGPQPSRRRRTFLQGSPRAAGLRGVGGLGGCHLPRRRWLGSRLVRGRPGPGVI